MCPKSSKSHKEGWQDICISNVPHCHHSRRDYDQLPRARTTIAGPKESCHVHNLLPWPPFVHDSIREARRTAVGAVSRRTMFVECEDEVAPLTHARDMHLRRHRGQQPCREGSGLFGGHRTLAIGIGAGLLLAGWLSQLGGGPDGGSETSVTKPDEPKSSP